VCGTESTVNSGLVTVQNGTKVLVVLVWLFRTDSAVKCGLVTVQIGSALKVRVSVSVWN
jgi:hypothetical protein